ncbi:chemotaxis protein CheW, partial [Desulfovibrio sp. DS-1]
HARPAAADGAPGAPARFGGGGA